MLEKLKILAPTHPEPPTAGYSCSHMAFLFQEALLETRRKGGKAFVDFLDVRKAFETVWHKGLLVKLFRKGIKGHFRHLINNWYTCPCCWFQS